MDRRGRREGTVPDIVERAQSKVVGRFYMDRGVAILEPEDKRLNQSIVLEPDGVARFKPESGQVIVGEVEVYPEQNLPAVAKSSKFWAIMPTAAWRLKLPCASIICRTNSVKRVPKP